MRENYFIINILGWYNDSGSKKPETLSGIKTLDMYYILYTKHSNKMDCNTYIIIH